MQKVKLVVRGSDGKIEERVHVVASTKSQNILIEEICGGGENVLSKTVEDVYFDKKAAEKEVAKMVKALISDAEIYEQVKEHVIKAMDSACAFYRPIKRPRKKGKDIIEK